MYRVVMVSGRVDREMYTFETEEEAVGCCESYGWDVAPDGDGGFVWDLEIQED